MPGGDGAPERSESPVAMRASALLRVKAVWITPIVLASVLIALMTLIYVGSVVDPLAHLSGLPVLVVNEDAGAALGGTQLNLGHEVTDALEHTKAVSNALSLRNVTLTKATAEMNRNAAYATIVIGKDFTRSTLAVYGLASTDRGDSAIPTIDVVTNPRAGSIGVSLATGVAQPALKIASLTIGSKLSALSHPSTAPSASTRALEANPLTVTTTPFRPLPPHSALGLSAFYISLITIMCGFMAAILVNTTVDSALGYATTEIGTKWSQRAPVQITRWQTLVAKWVMVLVIVPLLVALMLAVAVGLLGMDAPFIWYLWLFTSFAGIVIGFGTLVFFAVLGALGQLVAILVFVYLALASSGGTIPLEALPGVLRFVANFEPLRQILDGVRSILYFNASGPAGLTRGVILTALGLVLWVVVGTVATRLYDRAGKYRMEPEMLAFVQRSFAAYGAPKDSSDASLHSSE